MAIKASNSNEDAINILNLIVSKPPISMAAKAKICNCSHHLCILISFAFKTYGSIKLRLTFAASCGRAQIDPICPRIILAVMRKILIR